MGKVFLVITAVLVASVEGTEVLIKNPENDFISNINNVQSLWKASHNNISKKGIKYVKGLVGSNLQFNSKMPKMKRLSNNIPDSFDARTIWSDCPSVASIKDQGHCKSCWAVQTAAVASDRLCINSKYTIKVNISAQYLLSCCSKCVSSQQSGCKSGYANEAWLHLQDYGGVTGGDYLSYEGCQPYEKQYLTSLPKCYTKCTNRYYSIPFTQDKHFAKDVYMVEENEADIQGEILQEGPVLANMMVYRDFIYYKSGIYVKTSDEIVGGHSIKLIGWGVENGIKYWLALNSWNKGWGENGTFKIRRGTNECKVETYVMAGLMDT